MLTERSYGHVRQGPPFLPAAVAERPHDALIAHLNTMFAPLRVWNVEWLGGGVESDVFAAQIPEYGEVAIKIPRHISIPDHDGHAVHSRDLLLQEKDLMSYVRQFGIPAPRVYGVHLGEDGVDFLVSERLYPDGSATNPYELGTLAARIHALPVPIGLCAARHRKDFGAGVVNLLCARLRTISELTRERIVLPSPDVLMDLLEPTKALSLLHMDLRPENILSKEGQVVGVIDWFNSLVGDPGLELCRIAEYGLLDDYFIGAYGTGKLALARGTELIYRAYTASMLAILFLAEAPNPLKASIAVSRVQELLDELHTVEHSRVTIARSVPSTDTAPEMATAPAVRVPVEVLEALQDIKSTSALIREWAAHIAEALDRMPAGLAIRLGEHCREPGIARFFGRRVAEAICAEQIAQGAPGDMWVEYDVEQESLLEAGRRTRTLLPHHDGGNASYLTPSILDDPEWDATLRRTRVDSINTTRNHKLYQGFLLMTPGDAASITCYYDLLAVVSHAFTVKHHRAAHSYQELARWVGQNIRNAIHLLSTNNGTYLTLGGLLGSRHTADILVSIHYGDAPFSAAQKERFPELAAYCGSQENGETLQFFSDVLTRALGMSWDVFRGRFESRLFGKQYDLILGNNITLLHSGFKGGRGRKLEPICFVVSDPKGIEYEQWLWKAWRRGSPGIVRRSES